MLAYVTKYTPTNGILLVEGELDRSGKYFKSQAQCLFVRWLKEAFPTLEEAQKDALKRLESNVKAKRRTLERAEELLTEARQKGVSVKDSRDGGEND